MEAPKIELEPEKPKTIWYKRTKVEGKETEVDTKVKVTISTDCKVAEYIHYTAIGAHNEKRDETNPVGKNEKIEIFIEESGITTITAITVAGEYMSPKSTEVIKLDNIKPEILEGEEGIKITPTPRRIR